MIAAKQRANAHAVPRSRQGLSWITVKDILRTMQRVLSCSSKDAKPPFSQEGFAISERDKLQMKIESREDVSVSWPQAKRIAEQVYKLDVDGARKKRYATVFLLAAATGLRCSKCSSRGSGGSRSVVYFEALSQGTSACELTCLSVEARIATARDQGAA